MNDDIITNKSTIIYFIKESLITMTKKTEQLELAHLYYENGELIEAVKYFRKIGINKLNDDDKILVAKLLYKLQEQKEAYKIINGLIEQCDVSMAYIYKAYFHTMAEELEVAATITEKAIAQFLDGEHKQLIFLYVYRALLLIKLNNHKEARNTLATALTIDANDINIEEELIDAIHFLYEEFEFTSEAIELLTLVIEKAKSAYAHSKRANILFEIDKNEDALFDLDEAIRLSPETSLYWYNRGLAKSALQNYEGAITDFNETIKREDDHSQFSTYYELARAYVDMQDYKEAANILQYLVEDWNRALPHYYLELGLSLEELGELEKAIISLEKGRELLLQFEAEQDKGLSAFLERANYNHSAYTKLRDSIRNHFDFHLPLARLYRYVGLWSYAEDMLKKAILINAESSEPYFEWVRLYQAQNNEEEALRILVTLNEKFPAYPIAIYWLADYYYRLQRYEEAININSNLLDIEDDDTVNFIQRGKILDELQRFEEAVEAYSQAIALNDESEARMKRAFAYYKIECYEEALTDLQEALSLNKDLDEDAEYYILLGQIYAALGNWKAAIMFSTAIRLNPNRIWLYIRLAEIYTTYNELEEAEKILRKAFEIGHNTEEPYYGLARFYREQERYDEVKEILLKLHESFSASPTSLFWLTEAYHHLSNLEEALQVSNELIVLENDDDLNFIQRGAIFVDANEYEAAIEAYTAAIQLKESANVYMKRSYASFCIGNYDEALEDINRANELDAELKEEDYYHIALGHIFFETELWEHASAAFASAQQISPHEIWLYEKRASCLMKLEEYETAITVCTSGLDIDAKNPQLYWLRGLLHFMLKQYEEALEDAKSYLELDSENGDAHYNLGLVYEKLEQYDEAFASFTKSIKLNAQHAESYLERAYIYYHRYFETEHAIDDLLQWILLTNLRLTVEEKLEKIDELSGFNEQIVNEVKQRLKEFSVIDSANHLLH